MEKVIPGGIGTLRDRGDQLIKMPAVKSELSQNLGETRRGGGGEISGGSLLGVLRGWSCFGVQRSEKRIAGGVFGFCLERLILSQRRSAGAIIYIPKRGTSSGDADQRRRCQSNL